MSLDNLEFREALAHGEVGVRGRGELELTACEDEKVYDGVRSSARHPTVRGELAENHLVIATQRFEGKNVGKTTLIPELRIIDRSGRLVDYVVKVRSALGEIRPRPFTVCAETEVKEYDGSTSSAVIPRTNALAHGDSAIARQEFDTPTIGNGKTITPTIWINDGNEGKNYQIILIPIHNGAIVSVTSGGASPREILASQLGTDNFALITIDGLTNFTGEVCYVDDKKVYLKLEAKKRMQLIIEMERITQELREAEVGKKFHVEVKGKVVEARMLGQASSSPVRGRPGR